MFRKVFALLSLLFVIIACGADAPQKPERAEPARREPVSREAFVENECYRLPLQLSIDSPLAGKWDGDALRVPSFRHMFEVSFSSKQMDTSVDILSYVEDGAVFGKVRGEWMESSLWQDDIETPRLIRGPSKTIEVFDGVAAFYDWQPFGDGIVGVATLSDGRDALVEFSGDDARGLAELNDADTVLRELSRVAVVGEEVYTLYFHSSVGPVILTTRPKTRSGEYASKTGLVALRPEFRIGYEPPRFSEVIPEDRGRRTIERIRWEEYGFSTRLLPQEIVGWNGVLYLVSKSKMGGSGKTDWDIAKIGTGKPLSWAAGEEVYSLRLPTRAAHLVVVPGNPFWALIERDRVQAVGPSGLPYYPARAVTLVPDKWIANPMSGDLSSESRALCVDGVGDADE